MKSIFPQQAIFASPEPAPVCLAPAGASEWQVGCAHPSAFSWAKRLLDVLGGLVGLGILLVLVVPVAIAIKLDSPGPVFFAQERRGLLGRSFTMYKFRSMVVDAEALKAQVHNEAKGLIFKNTHDPRVTRVGRFLRKTSLDEFPQFWNVLKGEMSLVGTRPPTPDEVANYAPHHWQRLNVKPGITGEWQAHGRSLIQDFEDIVQLDVRYQSRWHPLYDVVLLGKTVANVLLKNDAC